MINKIQNTLVSHKLAAESGFAFILTVGILYLMDKTLTREYFLTLIVFIASYTVVHFGLKSYNKRRLKYSLFFSVPFAVAFWLGQKVVYQSINIETLNWLDLPLILVLVTIFTLMSVCVFAFVDGRMYSPTKNKQKLEKKNWLIYSLIILACWIPFFLVFFPGLISVDSAVQIRQAVGESSWSNWHPVLHTLFVAGPINLGILITGDLTAGIALATILQMVILSVIFGYIVSWSIQETSKKWVGRLFLIFFALCPVVVCYAMTMWKDILFSAFFALLVIKIYDFVKNHKRGSEIKIKDLIVVLILVLVVSFLRNGGVLIVVAIGIPLIVYYKNKRWIVGLSFLTIILCNVLVQGPIYKIFNVQSSPFMESMSVPAQQLGYVTKVEDLSEQTLLELSKYADIECLKNNYSPMNADPAKNCFEYDVVNEDKFGLIEVWFNILPQHFMKYVKAYILQTYSYWYIQSDVWVLDLAHVHEDKWLKMEYSDMSLLGDFLKDKIMKMEQGLMASSWLGWMNSVGVLFWFMYFALIMFMYQRRYEMLLVLSGVFVYMLSLLIASPVSWIFRYVYSLMLIAPILITISFIKLKKGKI